MSSIHVEVVFALQRKADSVTLKLPAGATVRDAIAASGLGAKHLVDWQAVGVFGRRVEADARLRDGDRVEIYRPLALDPKEQRRQRARKKPTGTIR